MDESGSEASYFILETRKFEKVTILSEDIKKPWLKSTLKEIKDLINNNIVLVQDTDKGENMNTCMDVYKARIQYDESLGKLKLRIVVRGDMRNKELVGDTWSPTYSMRNLKYFLGDSVN